MNIAELFIKLGVKGDGGAKKALTGVSTQLGEVKSMSLEAKAAILGVVYGLKSMMGFGMNLGTGLQQFSHLTGMSAEALQRWQYAGRQVSVSNEEVENSLKGVQQAMSNMLIGKGAPEGMAMLADKVGFDMEKARDTFYVMKKLQEFAKTMPADIGNTVLRSFGVGDGMIQGLRRNGFTDDIMKRAPVITDAQSRSLEKSRVQWENIENKFQMGIAKMFSTKDGANMIRDIGKLADKVLVLTEALIKLAEKAKVFELIGKSLEGLGLIVGDTTQTVSNVSEAINRKGVMGGLAERASAVGAEYMNIGRYMMQSLKESVEPSLPSDAKIPNQQNIQIQQNLNFQHDGKDAQKTSRSVRDSAEKAYRQMGAQRQGN